MEDREWQHWVLIGAFAYSTDRLNLVLTASLGLPGGCV
jgi:hypothetical protein